MRREDAGAAPEARTGTLGRVFKWLFRLCLAVVLLLAVAGAALFFLPRAVSTDWFRAHLEKSAARTLKRPVQVERLHWTWRDGLLAEGVRLPDDPSFSAEPLLTLDRLAATVDLRHLPERRLGLDLRLEGLHGRLIRNPEGRTNLEALLEGLGPPEAEEKAPAPRTDWRRLTVAVPLDLQGRIHLKGISLDIEDRSQERRLALREASLLLEIPSLLEKPITLSAASQQELDGRTLPPAELSLSLEGLVDPEGRLAPARTRVTVNGRLPGTRIEFHGSPGDMGLQGRVALDLAALAAVARPLAGQALPEIAGRLELVLGVTPGEGGSGLGFRAAVTGEDLAVSGGALGEATVGPVRIKASQEGVADLAGNRLEVSEGEIRIQDRTRLAWNGHVSRPGAPDAEIGLALTSSFLDLAELSDLAGALLPLKAAGGLEIGLKVSGNPSSALAFDADVAGQGLTVSGGAFKGHGLGPVAFRLSQAGTLNISGRTLEVDRGAVLIRDLMEVAWKGRVRDFDVSGRRIDAVIGPLSLDLGRLQSLTRGVFPLDLPFPVAAGERKTSPRLEVREVRLEETALDGPGRLRVGDLVLAVPAIEQTLPQGVLAVEGLELRLLEADLGLEALFPRRATASGRLRARGLGVQGPEKIAIQGLEIPRLELRADGIRPSPGSLFGITGALALKQSLTLEALEAGSLVRGRDLHQSLEAEVRLGVDSSAHVRVQGLALSSPGLRFRGRGEAPVEIPLNLEAGPAAIEIRGPDPWQVDVPDLQARVEAGEAFQARVTAHARDLGAKGLDLEGELSLRPGDLMGLIRPESGRRMDLEGILRAGWAYRGRLPQAGEIERLKSGEGSLAKRLRKADFIEQLDLSADLKALSLVLPLAGAGGLEVQGIDSARPVSLTLKKGLRQGKMEGEVRFGRILALPVLGKLDRPLDALLSFSGEQDNLSTVRFEETLRLQPLNAALKLNLNLDKIDRLLTLKSGSLLAAVLKHLEGGIQGRIELNPGEGAIRLSDAVSLGGGLEAGADLQLKGGRGGREIRLENRIESPRLDLQAGKDVQVSNLRSHLRLEKAYAVVSDPGVAEGRGPSAPPLSEEVLRAGAGGRPPEETREGIARRLRSDLRGRTRARPSLAFDTARIQAGPLSLEILDHEMEVRLSEGLPVIDFLQMDLLGGTLIGSAALLKGKKAYRLETQCSFSGLNAAKLTAEGRGDGPQEEAELSGRLALSTSLGLDPRQVLKDLDADLHITHIGVRTLERLLYALDPYESNETVVKQRKLLRVGTPRWIRMRVRNGSLSLSGQVEVGGVAVDLPGIDRVRAADLPVHHLLETRLSQMGPLLEFLRILSAGAVYIDPEGALQFVPAG